MDDAQAVRALKDGNPLAAEKLIEMRSKGMHEIRFEFIIRVLRSGASVSTLSVYWEHGHVFMPAPSIQSVSRRLVFGQRQPVCGEFLDMWLVCYPHDAQIKNEVDQEIDRMVEKVLETHARD